MKTKDCKEQNDCKQKIYEYLDKLPSGVFDLDKIVIPENRDKFIEVVKSYIDQRGRGYNGFDMDFNSDFTKLHKFDLVL